MTMLILLVCTVFTILHLFIVIMMTIILTYIGMTEIIYCLVQVFIMDTVGGGLLTRFIGVGAGVLGVITVGMVVGGAGTIYTVTYAKDVSYFRIDDPDNGKPGYLTLKNARYIRYNSNGADGGDDMTSHYLTTTNPGNLKTNTYTKTGSTFIGWNTQADGSGVSYTDGQLMNKLEASKTPLTLYAQWE